MNTTEAQYRMGIADLLLKADKLRKKVHYDNVPLSIVLYDAYQMAKHAEKLAQEMK